MVVDGGEWLRMRVGMRTGDGVSVGYIMGESEYLLAIVLAHICS